MRAGTTSNHLKHSFLLPFKQNVVIPRGTLVKKAHYKGITSLSLQKNNNPKNSCLHRQNTAELMTTAIQLTMAIENCRIDTDYVTSDDLETSWKINNTSPPGNLLEAALCPSGTMQSTQKADFDT